MKENTISIIIAKKGSGKSVFSQALALAQDKKVFWITPIVGAYYMLPCDCIGYDPKKYTLENRLQTNYINADRDNIEQELEKIKRIARNSEKGLFLVIDELDYYASSRLFYKSNIFELINYGRHLQIDLVFIARRLQDIPTNAQTNADFFYLGQNNNIENDLKYYENFLKKGIIYKSKALEKGQFIKYDTKNDKYAILRLKRNLVERIEKQ